MKQDPNETLQGNHPWTEYKKLVMASLERLEDELRALNEKLDALRNEDLTRMKIDIATIKAKAAVLGCLAGFIPSLISVIVMLMKNR